MPKQIFGAASVVATLNRAFNDQSPSNATFENQVAAAGTTADSQMAFAKQFGAGYAGMTADALSTKLLGNLGVLPNAALQTALKDYITAAGVANIGIIALQLGDILSGLENATGDQAGFAAAALAWNNEVTASYNYSANPANTGPGPVGPDDQAVTGVTLPLTVGTDFISPAAAEAKYKTTANNDTINAAENTLESVDTIDGGGGTDTLKAVLKVTDTAGADDAVTATTVAATTSNVEKIFITANLSAGAGAGGAGVDGAQLTVNAAGFAGVQELWLDGLTTTAVSADVVNSVTFSNVNLATTVGVKGALPLDATFNFAKATGLTDTASLALNGVSGAGAIVLNDIETLNVKSGTAASTVILKGTTLESLVVTGDKGLTADLTNLTATLKSVDASAATGPLSLTTGAIATASTIKTGTGADTVTLTGAAAKATVDLGAGNDTIVLTGSKAHALTLGGGVDTVTVNKVAGAISTTSAGTVNASAVTVADFVSGTDKIQLSGAAIKTLTGTQLSEVLAASDLKAAVEAAQTKSVATSAWDAVVFQYGSDSYVFFNTGATANAVDSTDTLIKLTGVGTLAASDVVAVI